MDQGLLRKNPAMTEQEFQDHYFNKHSQLVIPFFLHSGIKYYEQVRPPSSFHPLLHALSRIPIFIYTYTNIICPIKESQPAHTTLFVNPQNNNSIKPL